MKRYRKTLILAWMIVIAAAVGAAAVSPAAFAQAAEETARTPRDAGEDVEARDAVPETRVEEKNAAPASPPRRAGERVQPGMAVDFPVDI